MKFNKKAGVPIGTIAIIIIVLIASIGMWWWFTQGQCAQYDDIRKAPLGWYYHKDYINQDDPDRHPPVIYVENYVAMRKTDDGNWYVHWQTPQGIGGHSTPFANIPELLGYNTFDKQYDVGMKIWNAIKSGCV